MTTTTPDQGDERRAFVALDALDDLEAAARGDEPFPYQAAPAIRAYIESTLSAAQPVAQEAIAWSLRFDDDPRLNLSTVFDTEDEAKEYATRCGSATPVPLFAAPQPSQGIDYCDPERIKAWNNAAPPQPASAEAGKGVEGYVECRECSNCGHVGINDSSDSQSACNTCDWTGPEPKEDECPGCKRTGTMTAACPECGERYHLLAESGIKTSRPSESVAVSGEVSERVAKCSAILTLIDNYAPEKLGTAERTHLAVAVDAVLALAGSGGKARG